MREVVKRFLIAICIICLYAPVSWSADDASDDSILAERRKVQFPTDFAYALFPYPYSLPGIGQGLGLVGGAMNMVDTYTDAYGIILRGPAHLAGVSYGYVVAFTCDGHYWVFRLDGINPWQTKELVDETKSNVINTGSDKLNVIGVRADGETLTIYGNGYQLAQVKDNKFSQGRIGVFVRAVNTSNYTFRLIRLAYWVLNTPK